MAHPSPHHVPHAAADAADDPAGMVRRGSATFDDLLQRAGSHILDAQQHCAELTVREVEYAVASHRDLAAALALLGRTLVGPQPAAGRIAPEVATARRGVAALEQLGAARPWDEPIPVTGPCEDLHGAARAVRAAADLWSTHHDPAGAPRGPESSRLRHPAVLGAASRAWLELVGSSAVVADRLADLVAALDVDPSLSRKLRLHPRVPGASSAITGGQLEHVGVTVARPPIRQQQGPLTELHDRVLGVRQRAWSMARNGSAPVLALKNMAAIGEALSRAARAVEWVESPAWARATGGPTHTRSGGAWAEVCEIVSTLRSPHYLKHPIQVERMAIERLLARVTARGSGIPRAEVAAALADAIQLYSQVAMFNLDALLQAHARGDVYIVGSAIPGNVITRGCDVLLEVKLAKSIAPVPAFTIRRLQRAYRAVAPGPDPVANDPTAA